ncbi:MAG: ATP phosphoribosyltransferase regulatory subunit [Pseudomonadota bacterium]
MVDDRFGVTAHEGLDLAEVEHALERLAGLHAEAGYAIVSPTHLFRAELMLDLYGEDIRGRAFLFPGGGGGEELCLRPDFTVPVVLAHAAQGWDRQARYAYQGPVFRRQEPGSTRPVEYLQAGIENLGAADAATADSQVFSLTLKGIAEIGPEAIRVTTGDLGIPFALLEALAMPARRRQRLRRHFWRPARFRGLLDAAVRGPEAPSLRRADLIAALGAPDPVAAVATHAAAAGEITGLRELDELVSRAERLAGAEAEPPMPAEQAELIEAVTEVAGPSGEALSQLRRLTAEAGADITAALDRFEARLDALNRSGVDAEDLSFDAAFGRNLEYYDGFVFEVLAEGRTDLPPLAGGGRFDAMTRQLGAAHAIPAVGAMIRPEAALLARRGAA